jgi:anaerobic ribonucleoside-triphosphate reductase activating protein
MTAPGHPGAPGHPVASSSLNVAIVVPCTEAEGPGRRYALWVQGCPLRCPGCCNPEMLPVVERTRRSVDDITAEVLAAREEHGIEGISLLGGEPTRQAGPLADVAAAAQAAGLSVMVYSGFTLAELQAEGDDDVRRLLSHTDLLVDGRYDETRRTTTRRFIGSDNQMLHFLTTRYRRDDPRLSADNTVELRVRVGSDGALFVVNGWPVHGARTR